MKQAGAGINTANDVDRPSPRPLPWLEAPLRHLLSSQRGYAVLLHGPGGVGQFELALALARGWLCEAVERAPGDRPCGTCASCRLAAAGSHPDLLVVVPQAMRESLGLQEADAEQGGDDRSAGKKKPSRDIRVEDMRSVIAFALSTSARGRCKVVVVHPAERMNAVAANAFLKTLEEPAGDARFVLCSAAVETLAPTVRSRCQAIAVTPPPRAEATQWLREHGIAAADADALLDASGGRPLDVIERAAVGIDAAAWRALPGRVAAGDASALRGWPLPWVVDDLQKLCHDAMSIAAGASPRYFPPGSLPPPVTELRPLLDWAEALRRSARHADHPWNVELAVESLVEQGRKALQTPRSAAPASGGRSIHSSR